jgi:bacteriochlorophyllide a dehydrogenase
MQALMMTPPGTVRLVDEPQPEPGAAEVLIAVAYSGVSPGTELRCLAGQQDGAPADGFIPGYQGVGRVAACPSGRHAVGAVVFYKGTQRSVRPRVWGGHVAQAVVSGDAVWPVADEVPLPRYAFAKLAAIAHHGLQVAAITGDERVAVIGLGPVGFFAAQILAATGHTVTAFDLSPARVAAARGCGIDARVIERAAPTASQVVAVGVPDVVIDCTGVPALLRELVAAGRDLPWSDHGMRGLRLVVQGSYAGDIIVPYGAAFTKELTLLVPRDHHDRDLEAALRLLECGRIGLPDDAVLIADPREAQASYTALQTSRDLPLSVAFRWQ